MLELLTEKFSLFSGIFGASDEILGSIESGVDFEKRILAIYQQCRTPDEIDTAFRALQAELDEQIRTRLADTRKALLENFDEDVHERLRLRLADTQATLDRVSRRFWAVTQHMLAAMATFDESTLAFDLHAPPTPQISLGRYHLISKTRPQAQGGDTEEISQFLYRLSHPLGQHDIDAAKALPTPPAEIVFDISGHPARLSVIEALKGKAGWLTLRRLGIESYEREEHLLCSGFAENGMALDQETMERLFLCAAKQVRPRAVPPDVQERLHAEAERHAQATISRSLETNSRHFQEAREKLERWADDMVLAAEKALS